MRLYNVPKNTWVRGEDPDCKDIFLFDHIDGMYSYCHGMEGNVCHYVAWMEVEIMKDQDPDLTTLCTTI